MNPSLTAALAMHGIPDAGDDTTSTRGAIANAKVLCMTMHPSLPRVAYLEEWDEEVKGLEPPSPSFIRMTSSSKSSKTTSTTTTKRSRLVVREYSRIRSRDAVVVAIDDDSDDSNLTLASLSMEKLTSHIDQFRSSRRKGGGSLSQKITDQSSLSSVGMLTSVTFLDSNAMHWGTRRGRGAVSDMDLTVTIDEEANDILFDANDIAASLTTTTTSSTMGRGLCLGLQFSRALVLLRLRDRGAKCTILCFLQGQRSSSLASSGGAKNAAAAAAGGGELWIPTSAPLPISTSVVVYGCSDGAMRFHDLAPSKLSTTGRISSSSSSIGIGGRQSTIKSVRGPNGRSDLVVAILNIDPAYDYNDNDEKRKSTIPLDSNTAPSVTDNNTLVLCSRILTVCGSGVAFVWDVNVSIDRSTGTLRDLTVLPVSSGNPTRLLLSKLIFLIAMHCSLQFSHLSDWTD